MSSKKISESFTKFDWNEKLLCVSKIIYHTAGTAVRVKWDPVKFLGIDNRIFSPEGLVCPRPTTMKDYLLREHITSICQNLWLGCKILFHFPIMCNPVTEISECQVHPRCWKSQVFLFRSKLLYQPEIWQNGMDDKQIMKNNILSPWYYSTLVGV